MKVFTQSISIVVALISCMLINSAAYAGQVSRGAMLANSCATCHGTDGKSPGSIPAIHGKSAAYLIQTMIDFRDGNRPSTVMGRHAKGYSDEEIKLIADFFAR